MPWVGLLSDKTKHSMRGLGCRTVMGGGFQRESSGVSGSQLGREKGLEQMLTVMGFLIPTWAERCSTLAPCPWDFPCLSVLLHSETIRLF